ncbi:hypothetical protein EHS25_007083 [Saitozyma podzolica]|uniref:Uncharacterized protein n=1 Tax=Saitozyma podzolica TaxID=1890683 RepID=A0A427XPI6_9TREE|nr:hypothetical protein EHS25_007083 [Saitozyma podzolica]
MTSSHSSDHSARKSGQTIKREAAKLAWQVIGEEFGDGDLEKNHVYVYRQLLESLSNSDGAPAGCELGFDGLADDDGSPRCWTAAVAQQCIGLLASTNEFFPEALGFNMAYETLPYHLLVTSRELRELGIDDYYFALHVTIDNPDSGHAALALEAVERFLLGVKERDGDLAMEQMWKRVQADVILADGLPTTPCSPIDLQPKSSKASSSSSLISPVTDVESHMVSLLARKAGAAEKMHCPSRLLIQDHTIEHWLEPTTWTTDKGLVFLRALGEKKPWVVQGDCARSRLVRELEWGGRMFGAFTCEETALVKRWITLLGQENIRPSKEHGTYQSFVGESGKGVPREGFSRFDRRSRENLFKPGDAKDLEAVLRRFVLPQIPPPSSLENLIARGSCYTTSHGDPRNLAALWFTSISLLELFPLSPSKFATPLGAAVLRAIRAQLGFPSLHRSENICAGMDSVRDGDGIDAGASLGLWELGIIVCRRRGYEVPGEFSKLADSIEQHSKTATFCADMLELRTRPYRQQALLLGCTCGFTVHLYSSPAIALSLDVAQRARMEQICRDVVAGLHAAVETGRTSTHTWWSDFVRGFYRAEKEITTLA